MNDQEKALKEVGRVLKARGSILVQELTPERQGKLIKLAERWLRRAHVNFLNSADLDTKLENEGFLVKLTKPAVAGYYLVAGKK
jgi:ubiquinone/menaquinone biosynthesis C-methylase UbiE